jgi:hypothetical protein
MQRKDMSLSPLNSGKLQGWKVEKLKVEKLSHQHSLQFKPSNLLTFKLANRRSKLANCGSGCPALLGARHG